MRIPFALLCCQAPTYRRKSSEVLGVSGGRGKSTNEAGEDRTSSQCPCTRRGRLQREVGKGVPDPDRQRRAVRWPPNRLCRSGSAEAALPKRSLPKRASAEVGLPKRSAEADLPKATAEEGLPKRTSAETDFYLLS